MAGRGRKGYRRSAKWQRLRLRVYQRDGFRCVKCGWRPRHVPDDYAGREALYEQDESTGGRLRYLTLDHIVPVAAGGPTVESNLQTLCTPCNNAKGATLPLRAEAGHGD